MIEGWEKFVTAVPCLSLPSSVIIILSSVCLEREGVLKRPHKVGEEVIRRVFVHLELPILHKDYGVILTKCEVYSCESESQWQTNHAQERRDREHGRRQRRRKQRHRGRTQGVA